MVHLRQGTIHVGCCSSDPPFNIDSAFGNLVPCVNNITIFIFWRWKDKRKIKEYRLSRHRWINYKVFLFSVAAASPQVDFLIPEKINRHVFNKPPAAASSLTTCMWLLPAASWRGVVPHLGAANTLSTRQESFKHREAITT